MSAPLTDAPHLSGRSSDDASVSQADAAPIQAFAPIANAVGRPAKLWRPRRVLFTAKALEERHGRHIAERLDVLGVAYEVLEGDRLPATPRGLSTAEAYRAAKNTLAIVTSPPSSERLKPIPPSADYQFHLAKGCPAHCQYCYLAGSLPGAPITRAYANLDAILGNVSAYAARGTTALPRRPAHAAEHPEDLTFEASCYTDPLALEHLTGSLSTTISAFAKTKHARLRWVTKYDAIEPLMGLEHNGRTHCRMSLNAEIVARRLEGGTADLEARLHALRRLALPREKGGGGYPVGAVLAPLMPILNWQSAYTDLLDRLDATLDWPDREITFELITHRFTAGSREVLLDWYPATTLDFAEEHRSEKRNKFGGVKYVYMRDKMDELRGWFGEAIAARFGPGRVLYFT